MGNTTTVNIIISTVDYLLRLQVRKDKKGTPWEPDVPTGTFPSTGCSSASAPMLQILKYVSEDSTGHPTATTLKTLVSRVFEISHWGTFLECLSQHIVGFVACQWEQVGRPCSEPTLRYKHAQRKESKYLLFSPAFVKLTSSAAWASSVPALKTSQRSLYAQLLCRKMKKLLLHP